MSQCKRGRLGHEQKPLWCLHSADVCVVYLAGKTLRPPVALALAPSPPPPFLLFGGQLELYTLAGTPRGRGRTPE